MVKILVTVAVVSALVYLGIGGHVIETIGALTVKAVSVVAHLVIQGAHYLAGVTASHIQIAVK